MREMEFGGRGIETGAAYDLAGIREGLRDSLERQRQEFAKFCPDKSLRCSLGLFIGRAGEVHSNARQIMIKLINFYSQPELDITMVRLARNDASGMMVILSLAIGTANLVQLPPINISKIDPDLREVAERLDLLHRSLMDSVQTAYQTILDQHDLPYRVV